MSISRRSFVAGATALVAAPPVAQSAAPDVVTVRTVPPLTDWPDWTPLPEVGELRLTADSLQFIEPAPGYRFRHTGAGTIVHEPV